MADRIALIPVKGPIVSGGRSIIPMYPGPEMPELVREMVGKAKGGLTGRFSRLIRPGNALSNERGRSSHQRIRKPTVPRIKENGLSGAMIREDESILLIMPERLDMDSDPVHFGT